MRLSLGGTHRLPTSRVLCIILPAYIHTGQGSKQSSSCSGGATTYVFTPKRHFVGSGGRKTATGTRETGDELKTKSQISAHRKRAELHAERGERELEREKESNNRHTHASDTIIRSGRTHARRTETERPLASALLLFVLVPADHAVVSPKLSPLSCRGPSGRELFEHGAIVGCARVGVGGAERCCRRPGSRERARSSETNNNNSSSGGDRSLESANQEQQQQQ